MINPALAAQIHQWRTQASALNLPCGLLAWWGNTTVPDGLEGQPCVDQNQFEALFGLLQQGALKPDAVPSLVALKALTLEQRPDVEVPVLLVNLPYAAPKAAVKAQVCAAADAGTALPEPLAPLADVIEMRRAFMASALMHEQWGLALPAFRGRRVRFSFEPRFYVAATGQPVPNALQFDAGDGHGFQTVAMGGAVEAQFEAGLANAACALRLWVEGQWREARFSLALADQPAAPMPDDTWPLQAPSGQKGQAWVYLAPGHAQVTHPLIMAEGFPGGYAADYLYDMLDQHRCATALRAMGYDLILLGFEQGAASALANADVAQACVERAMATTPNPLVVGGVSMGGLVTRYALARMETSGQAHQTRMLLTIDTPHAGSHTSLGVQWFAQFFASSSPSAALLAYLLNTPANQEFVTTCLQGGTVGETPARQAFLAAMAAVGQYPQHLVRVAVSCGAGDGRPVVEPGAVHLRWQGSPFAQALLQGLPAAGQVGAVAAGGSLLATGTVPAALQVQSPIPWECAPGGQNAYNLIAAAIAGSLGLGTVEVPVPRTCTVPTISALDLQASPFEPVPPPGQGRSPFHDYTCCETNQMHLQFTPAVGAWLLNRLGDPRLHSR